MKTWVDYIQGGLAIAAFVIFAVTKDCFYALIPIGAALFLGFSFNCEQLLPGKIEGGVYFLSIICLWQSSANNEPWVAWGAVSLSAMISVVANFGYMFATFSKPVAAMRYARANDQGEADGD